MHRPSWDEIINQVGRSIKIDQRSSCRIQVNSKDWRSCFELLAKISRENCRLEMYFAKPAQSGTQVIASISSITDDQNLIIETQTKPGESLESISPFWKPADWCESIIGRDFGITFENQLDKMTIIEGKGSTHVV